MGQILGNIISAFAACIVLVIYFRSKLKQKDKEISRKPNVSLFLQSRNEYLEEQLKVKDEELRIRRDVGGELISLNDISIATELAQRDIGEIINDLNGRINKQKTCFRKHNIIDAVSIYPYVSGLGYWVKITFKIK